MYDDRNGREVEKYHVSKKCGYKGHPLREKKMIHY